MLDNFEHVLPAAPLVGELLAAGGRLKVLVTSRALLRLRAEYAYPVPPLALPGPPPPRAGGAPRAVRGGAPVRRARPRRAAGLRPHGRDARRPWRRSAAGWTGCPWPSSWPPRGRRLLPPRALLARLERRLPLLTGGARDAPARQQTLRAAIAWSYDLLDPPEQALFRRLAVFAGGCMPDAAAGVAAPDPRGAAPEVGDPGPASRPPAPGAGLDVLDGLAALVDHSLLRRDESPATAALPDPRFGMLETVREYALERLEASGEAEAVRRRHAAYCLALAARAAPELRGPRAGGVAGAAGGRAGQPARGLGWLAAHGDVERRLRLAGALWWFWYLGGHFGEGRAALEGACAAAGRPAGPQRGPATPGLVEALCGAGVLAYQQGEYGPAGPGWRRAWRPGGSWGTRRAWPTR